MSLDCGGEWSTWRDPMAAHVEESNSTQKGLLAKPTSNQEPSAEATVLPNEPHAVLVISCPTDLNNPF